MSSEKGPFQRENSSSIHHFSGAMLVFKGIYFIFKMESQKIQKKRLPTDSIVQKKKTCKQNLLVRHFSANTCRPVTPLIVIPADKLDKVILSGQDLPNQGS